MPLLDNETQISVLVEGLDHPEGIAWGLDGYAYAGGEAGQIYRIDIEKRELSEFANTGGFVLGMALDSSHNIYACDAVNKCIQKITPGGIVSVYSTGSADEPLTTPNYPAFDTSGNLFVCDSGDWNKDNGKIYKIAPGGDGQVWDRNLREFPNGLCIGPGGDYLYVAMSVNPPRISRIKIESDGRAGVSETVVELPMTVPDGVAFDTDGNLYASMYRPDRIYRYTPAGQLEVLAEDFQGTLIAGPTNIAFCGRALDTLLGANIGRWHISRYETGSTGLQLNYPTLEI